MKKTFKGYRVVMALLIALLVMSSVPMFAMADEVEPVPAEEETFEYTIGGAQHLLLSNPSTVYSEPTCGKDGMKEYVCLGKVDKDGNIIGECGIGGKHIVPDTNRPAHVEYAKSKTGSDCTTGGEIEIWCKVCKQHLRDEKLDKADHSFMDAQFSFYNLGKDGNQVKGTTYVGMPVYDQDEEGNEISWITSYFYPDYRWWMSDRTWEEAMKYEQDAIERFNKNYNCEIVLPTCQKEGSLTFICSKCGATEKYKIEKDQDMHTLSDWTAIEGAEPTCLKPGVVGRYCVDPGHADHAPFFSKSVPPLGHDWLYVKVKKYNDCIPSEINVVCSRCGESRDIDYDKVGKDEYKKINKAKIPTKHSFKEIKKWFVKEVPELELESKNYKFDGTKDDSKVIPKICTEDAVFVFKCEKWNKDHDADDINAYKVVERKASEHTYGAWVTVTAATETKEGFYTRKCTVCEHAQNKTGWLVNGEVVDKNGNTTAPIALSLDLAEVKNGEGTATVKVTSGEIAEDTKLYARVAWFYETKDGLTYGFTAIKTVDVDEDGNMTVDVSGTNPGDGFNFTDVQVVITTDKNAHKTAAYAEHALAMAKA